MPADESKLTVLLNRMLKGDPAAGDRAARLVYDELHGIARSKMRREGNGHMLQATALVNEVYVRLLGGATLQVQDRNHFRAIATDQMRYVLLDHARAAQAARRGGRQVRVELAEIELAGLRFVPAAYSDQILFLDEALRAFQLEEQRASRVMELKAFGGFTHAEIAETLGISVETVQRDFTFGKAWLYHWMTKNTTAGCAR
jgi:RNA polymerase sigma factor (TIGR02999 family)